MANNEKYIENICINGVEYDIRYNQDKKDYIESFGTTEDSWFYIKYKNSGIIECWYNGSIQTGTPKSWGTTNKIIEYENKIKHKLPFKMYKPICTISKIKTNTAGVAHHLFNIETKNGYGDDIKTSLQEETPTWLITSRVQGVSLGVTIYYTIHVIGEYEKGNEEEDKNVISCMKIDDELYSFNIFDKSDKDNYIIDCSKSGNKNLNEWSYIVYNDKRMKCFVRFESVFQGFHFSDGGTGNDKWNFWSDYSELSLQQLPHSYKEVFYINGEIIAEKQNTTSTYSCSFFDNLTIDYKDNSGSENGIPRVYMTRGYLVKDAVTALCGLYIDGYITDDAYNSIIEKNKQ